MFDGYHDYHGQVDRGHVCGTAGSNHKHIQRRSVYVWLTAFQYEVHEHARIHHSISLANWSLGNAFVDVARTSTNETAQSSVSGLSQASSVISQI